MQHGLLCRTVKQKNNRDTIYFNGENCNMDCCAGLSSRKIIETQSISMEGIATWTCCAGLFIPRTSSVSAGQSQPALYLRGSLKEVWNDDNFEGLVATKNLPPLRIISSSFPSSVDIQQRSFVKCTSHPEIHHGSQRLDWLSHVQHSGIRRDLSDLGVVAPLFHSVPFHFCS